MGTLRMRGTAIGLFVCLFRLYCKTPANDMVVVNWTDCGRKWSWPNLRYYPAICVTATRKTTNDCIADGRSWNDMTADIAETVQSECRVSDNSCRSKSSGTLDRASDVSKHGTAFTFRIKQFKESCLTLHKRTTIL